jgi:Ca-activated chloride channel family protein
MDLNATVRFDHELLAVEQEHTVACMLELTAPPAPAQAERRPLALSLVIDRSGSMRGRKIDVTRQCGAFLIERLAADDQLAIVSFDQEVRLDAPLLDVGPNREGLKSAVHAIQTRGQTGLSGGWFKGVEALSHLAEGTHTRRVLLLTDGMANVGITDQTQLAQMTRRSSADGIGTTTIGFGDGFSEDLLAAMADAGGGGAYFAETPDAAPGIFAQEFEDLLSLVAQNVSVEIRPAWEEVEVLTILNDFPQVPVGGGVQVQLGDAYGDERRRVVFELRIPRLAALGPAQVADLVIRYVSVGDEVAMHELTVPLVVNAVSADEAATVVPNADVSEEVTILLSARAQDEARELADRDQYDEASRKLREAADRLRVAAQASARSEELEAEARRLEHRSGEFSEGMYDARSRKLMTFENRMRKERRYRPAKGGGD